MRFACQLIHEAFRFLLEISKFHGVQRLGTPERKLSGVFLAVRGGDRHATSASQSTRENAP